MATSAFQFEIFDGEGDVDIVAWFLRFDDICEMNSTKVELKYRAVAMNMRGKAHAVLSGLPTETKKDFEALKKALIRKYAISEDFAFEKFVNTTKRENETGQEFAGRLRILATNFSDGEAGERLVNIQFVRGLPSAIADKLRGQLNFSNIKLEDRIASVDHYYEQNYSSTQNGRPAPVMTIQEAPAVDMNEMIRAQVMAVWNEKSKKKSFGPYCNRCAKHHKKDECYVTDAFTCFNCQEKGHVARACKKPKKSLNEYGDH